MATTMGQYAAEALSGLGQTAKNRRTRRSFNFVLWMKMVAGDCSGFDSRQDEDELISLGVWRINMLKSMKKYVDDVSRNLKQTENITATRIESPNADRGN